MSERISAARHWADSGLMWLTGHPNGAWLGAPRGLVDHACLGNEVTVDGLALFGERAALSGLARRGRASCGGATRLLQAADGWIAVSLPRLDDVELLPAWLGVEAAAEPRPAVSTAARLRAAADLVTHGSELGLAVSALGEAARRDPVVTERRGDAAAKAGSELMIVDLSSLWAGPLCAQLLGAAGARVTKVESSRRPDGSRAGPREFFDLLNGAKESVTLDLDAADGRGALLALIQTADVVVEASRPRALVQLGIDRDAIMARHAIRVWLSITGHGREAGMRIAFGDDAAVAGGLVAWEHGAPVFCADAIADPAAGLLAAATAAECLVDGGRWTVDVSLAGAAATGATGDVLAAVGEPARPRARSPTHRAPKAGATPAPCSRPWSSRDDPADDDRRCRGRGRIGRRRRERGVVTAVRPRTRGRLLEDGDVVDAHDAGRGVELDAPRHADRAAVRPRRLVPRALAAARPGSRCGRPAARRVRRHRRHRRDAGP